MRRRELYQVHASGCWIATGGLTGAGYGRATVDGVRGYLHRLMWQQKYGPVLAGMELDHLCRNRACCNPAHLEAVTHGENVRRGRAGHVNRARQLARTECVNGHLWSAENTKRTARQRKCRECERTQQRARRAERKAA